MKASVWRLGIPAMLLVRSAHSAVEPARAPAQDLTIVTADGLLLAATFRRGEETIVTP